MVPLPARVTGANLRAVGDRRRGYGTDRARETMRRLMGMGVNTLGLLMEGRMENVHDTEISLPSRAELQALERGLADANALGLATVLIPHLFLDDGTWRGEIRWPDPENANAWWSDYEAFILRAAEIADRSGTTVLSLGVELKAMSAEPGAKVRLARVAARVREVYRGLLTYNANWDEGEQVGFWDLVDVAGVNGYYPLVPDPVRGAGQVAVRLGKLAALARRPLVVLEVGYRAGPASNVRPWEWPEHIEGAQVDDGAQAAAYAAVLSEWLAVRGVQGLMFWVVPTDPDDPASEPRHGFNPLNRPAEEVIRRAFLGQQRPDT